MAHMPYIIDGHNLIPKIPGLSLSDIDDEEQLINLLQEFCRRRSKKAEVYFDNAPPGQLRARNYGLVTAHFVRAGQIADDAIRARLQRMGREARNWTVVSSDHAVQASAKAARAQVISSDIFAHEIIEIIDDVLESGDPEDSPLNSDEIEDWLEIFGGDKPD
jgi:predicted RNA-binding protein with PIN domain